MTIIDFYPCTGFGSEGRTASLNINGKISTGHGATDEEAVLEALIDSGLSFDAAFDRVGATLADATINRC